MNIYIYIGNICIYINIYELIYTYICVYQRNNNTKITAISLPKTSSKCYARFYSNALSHLTF